MKFVVLAFLLSFTIAAQEPDYPDGTLCTPQGIMADGKIIDDSPDHKCFCKNMGDPQTSCEKPMRPFDPSCTRHCKEDKCGCPLTCASMHH